MTTAGYLTHRPSRGRITEPFGPREVLPTPTSPAIHYGDDYGWGNGLGIYAARTGRVKSYAYAGAYGNRLVIDHGGGIETWYCHLTRALVAVDSNVQGGQEVAVMGATGNVTATHLHHELRINGVATNPAPYYPDPSLAALAVDPILQEDTMHPTGYYAKGDQADATFYISQETGLRRPVSLGELTAAQRWDEATGRKFHTGVVVVMPQAILDAIPYAPTPTA